MANPQVKQYSGDLRMWLLGDDNTRTPVIPANDDADGNQPIEASSFTTTYEPGDETNVVSRRRGSRYNQPVHTDVLPGTTEVSITLLEMPPIVLARAFHGDAANADIVAGTVTDANLVVTHKNSPLTLPHRYLKSTPLPVVLDGATPLVAGTDYTIDYRRGTVVIKAAAVTVGDTLTISYSYEGITSTKILGGATPTKRFYLTGDMENRIGGDQGLLEVFDARLTSGEDVDWLSQEPLTVTLTGTLVVPSNQPAPYTFQTYKLSA